VFCNSELRSFERRLNEFHARGVEIAAISVDTSEESRKLCGSEGYTFPFLSDPKADVIRRYGVLHPRAGPDGQDVARPAEFLIDAAGAVRWVTFTDDLKIRARPENVLKAIDELMPSRPSLGLDIQSGGSNAPL
jgi:peroxiredoxin